MQHLIHSSHNLTIKIISGCDSSPRSPKVSLCVSHLLQLYKSFKLQSFRTEGTPKDYRLSGLQNFYKSQPPGLLDLFCFWQIWNIIHLGSMLCKSLIDGFIFRTFHSRRINIWIQLGKCIQNFFIRLEYAVTKQILT